MVERIPFLKVVNRATQTQPAYALWIAEGGAGGGGALNSSACPEGDRGREAGDLLSPGEVVCVIVYGVRGRRDSK